jgi:hypothetical protein
LSAFSHRRYRSSVTQRLTSEDAERWYAWLRERSHEDTGCTGFDAGGWEDSTWVLHSIFEQPGGDGGVTHDDLLRAALRSGDIVPRSEGERILHERCTTIGSSMSMSTPRPGWLKLRWRALAERLAIDLSNNRYPPCYRWFPYSSWPATLHPPNEGTLDRTCLGELVDALASSSGSGRDTPCMAYYSPLANGARFDQICIYEVALGEIVKLVRPLGHQQGTPNNFWPVDESWMVFTDHDLWGTKVSGPRGLIDALRASRDLECIDWAPPSGTPGA